MICGKKLPVKGHGYGMMVFDVRRADQVFRLPEEHVKADEVRRYGNADHEWIRPVTIYM